MTVFPGKRQALSVRITRDQLFLYDIMMIGILNPEGVCLNEVVWQFHVKHLPNSINTDCCTNSREQKCFCSKL